MKLRHAVVREEHLGEQRSSEDPCRGAEQSTAHRDREERRPQAAGGSPRLGEKVGERAGKAYATASYVTSLTVSQPKGLAPLPAAAVMVPGAEH